VRWLVSLLLSGHWTRCTVYSWGTLNAVVYRNRLVLND
jgi:hypothetical protein